MQSWLRICRGTCHEDPRRDHQPPERLKRTEMRPSFVIFDLHIGAIRSGGTTPATALKLRQDLLFGYQQLLDMADGSDLLINGDLFDTANVPLTDMFTALQLTDSWMRANTESQLYLPPGNHDLSKNRE